MPDLDDFLHYRIVDVSSIKELSRRWFPRAYFAAPTKRGNHRALADILESIEELRYYRAAVFVPSPGPDSAEAKALAHEVGGSLTGLGHVPPDGSPEALIALHFLAGPGWIRCRMVGVAQLVERRVVVADVAGSSPVTHPTLDRYAEPLVRSDAVRGSLLLGSPSRWSAVDRCDAARPSGWW